MLLHFLYICNNNVCSPLIKEFDISIEDSLTLFFLQLLLLLNYLIAKSYVGESILYY